MFDEIISLNILRRICYNGFVIFVITNNASNIAILRELLF